MDREAVREGLQKAGLSAYQADAYLTLLERGTSPAVDIAKNCSVPVPRIYDVLKDLEQMGYIETLDKDTLHARGRYPVDVIEELHDRSELLSDTANEIEDRWEASPLGEHEMNVMKRADTVIDHAKELIRDAETVVDLAVTDTELFEFESALRDAFENDVVVRISIYPEEYDSEYLEDHPIGDIATEIRGRTIPGPLLVLVDRSATCFSPTTRMPDPYGVVINDTIMSFVFQWYFQTCLWSVWDTVYEHQRFPIEYVSLEAFIRDIYPFWQDSDDISITVEGIDTTSGDQQELSGTLSAIRYGRQASGLGETPTVTELAGYATVELETDDHVYSIGSWGALFEDVEARCIILESIENATLVD